MTSMEQTDIDNSPIVYSRDGRRACEREAQRVADSERCSCGVYQDEDGYWSTLGGLAPDLAKDAFPRFALVAVVEPRS